MDAQKALITNIFNNATLIEVPFFQRPYVWDEELWAKFIEDMEFVVKTRRSHFLGAIILKDAGQPDPGDRFAQRRTIVDGQQRLTTFLLFMKVLCLKQNQSVTFDLQFRIMGQEIALRHGQIDAAAFEAATSATSLAKINNWPQDSRIIDAYNYFIDHVNPSKLDIMTIFMNAQFVRIDLGYDEDEQQIFDTINSLGVRLTTAELLKNYFYSREDIDQYRKGWVDVFEKDSETRAYWNQEFETGRITRSLIDVFFDSYFQLFVQNARYKVLTEDKIAYDRLEHLAKSYQDFIKRYCSGDKKVILGPMPEYAKKFRETFDPECVNRQMPKYSGLERINVIIFGLKSTTLIPYVLYLACNVEDQLELDKILGILEAYIMRRIVIRATTKNYNNLFVSLSLNRVKSSDALLNALKRTGDATTYVPSDEEMLNGFNNSKLTNLQAKGVLYFIESGLRSDKSSTALLGFKQYSLEHLMPRKWRNHWPQCDSEEAIRGRDQKIQTLGNFAIIPQSLNTSISDADWETKKNGRKDNPGLAVCATGLLTMDNVLSADIWDEQTISDRSRWLWENAKELWSTIAPAINESAGGLRGVSQSDNIGELRRRYWTYALPKIQRQNLSKGTFLNCNPTKTNTLSGYFGIRGCRVDCIANLNMARIDFYFSRSDAKENKRMFDAVYLHKNEIEDSLGVKLDWSRADDYVGSWIVYHLYDISVANEQDWSEMAEFHAEWSNKICDAIIPFIPVDNHDEMRLLEVSGWTREWAIEREDIDLDLTACNRNYTRFTTECMDQILPPLAGILSEWGTETHYFYEIVTTSQRTNVQLSINSKGITDDFRDICDRIQRWYPSRANQLDWHYRFPFRTKSLALEGADKGVVYQYLDGCMRELREFEHELVQRLDQDKVEHPSD